MSTDRETDIIQAFTGLTDRLVDNYDVVDLTTRLTEDCAQLLNVEAVGLLLADAGGVLHVLAATSAEARKLEAFQLQRDEGPCLDCYRTGEPVNIADLRAEAGRWPTFAASAERQGFRSVHAIPMRLRKERLGAMGLFGSRPGTLRDQDLQLAQGLAHVASLAIVQNNPHLDQANTLPALRAAVASRAVVEIAKGVLSEKQNLTMEEAFTRLRVYAHQHGQPLTEVARQIVSGDMPSDHLITQGTTTPS
jgi:transcriptional regulator with GAF, ATPase, and Fis domain